MVSGGFAYWLEEGNIKAVGSHAHHLLFLLLFSSFYTVADER